MARRLAHRTFTPALVGRAGASSHDRVKLVEFFTRPNQFLVDVMRELEPAQRAALACVYLAGEHLATPLQLTQYRDVIERLGASVPATYDAFAAIDGTFLVHDIHLVEDTVTRAHVRPAEGARLPGTGGESGVRAGAASDGRAGPRSAGITRTPQAASAAPVTELAARHGWRFRHPTLREGFAEVIATNPDTLDVYLDGLTDAKLVKELDCGGSSRSQGTLVQVPSHLFPRVAGRIKVPRRRDADYQMWTHPTATFLTDRCSPEFLREWSRQHVKELPALLHFEPGIAWCWELEVLGALRGAGALPEWLREEAVRWLVDQALEFDGGWLAPRVSVLFTRTEREALEGLIRQDIVPYLSERIDEAADGYESDIPGEERYAEAERTVTAYARSGLIDSAQAADARQYIADSITTHDEERPYSRYAGPRAASRAPVTHLSGQPSPDPGRPRSGRDEFDDVAADRT